MPVNQGSTGTRCCWNVALIGDLLRAGTCQRPVGYVNSKYLWRRIYYTDAVPQLEQSVYYEDLSNCLWIYTVYIHSTIMYSRPYPSPPSNTLLVFRPSGTSRCSCGPRAGRTPFPPWIHFPSTVALANPDFFCSGHSIV
jgi:hypothetical protein